MTTKTYPEEYIVARNQLISLKAEMKQAVANGGTLASTSSDLDVNKVTFGTPLLASSFQVRLDMDGDSIQKVNNVGVEYRPIHKRVT